MDSPPLVIETTELASFKPHFVPGPSVPRFKRPALLFILYMIVASICFYFLDDQMTGTKTNPILDALYFSVVTMTTGYGDLEPNSVATKLLSCFFVFVSMAAIALYMSQAADFIVEKQEALLLNRTSGLYKAVLTKVIKSNKAKFRLSVTTMSLLTLVIIGTVFLWKVEKLELVDSFYCVWGTITILGYGGKSFTSKGGRVFGVLWVMLTTVCVAQFFFYLTELTVEKEKKRAHRVNKWIVSRTFTTNDFTEADVNQDGQISAEEFILYKLKEMEKITEKEIADILKEFRYYDVHNKGKITKEDLTLDRDTEEDITKEDIRMDITREGDMALVLALGP